MSTRPVLTVEQIDEALDMLESATIFVEHFVSVEQAAIDGFDVDAFCERAHQLVDNVKVTDHAPSALSRFLAEVDEAVDEQTGGHDSYVRAGAIFWRYEKELRAESKASLSIPREGEHGA